jgi:two-component system KDP operon response regulator KdpE
LVIEDDAPFRAVLRAALSRADYAVVEAATAAEGERLARSRKPDVVLLDLGLPDRSGFSVIRALRAWTETPVLVLTGRDQEAQKIRALDGGADDYITKPCGPDELLARLRTALRHVAQRNRTREAGIFEVGDLSIDFARCRVWKSDREIVLSAVHYRLLLALVHEAGRVLSHAELLRRVWGRQHGTTHSLRSTVMALRGRLGDNPLQPRYIFAERGIGYRFATE